MFKVILKNGINRKNRMLYNLSKYNLNINKFNILPTIQK